LGYRRREVISEQKVFMIITCLSCGATNEFAQPCAYHAGFANQGFLYNDDGDLTLVWSSFDRAYETIVGPHHPWALTDAQRDEFERRLPPAPHGGRWRFANPPRCRQCREPIGSPIRGSNIYYLVYPGSINTDSVDAGHVALAELLSKSEPTSG
jgi:hypothetical protein